MGRCPIVALLVACASWCAAGLWSEDFTGANGTQPPGWSFTTAGGSSISIQSNTLFMSSPPPGASGEAWGYPLPASFPALSSWDPSLGYTVQFDFKIPDQNNHWFFVYVDRRVHTVIDYGDDFTYRYDNVNTRIMDLSPNRWYSMLYEVRPSAGVYDIYVDGVKRATAPTDPNTIFTPFWIGDRHSGSSDYGSAYWDHFQIATNLPEPTTSALLALGGLVAWAQRRLTRISHQRRAAAPSTVSS